MAATKEKVKIREVIQAVDGNGMLRTWTSGKGVTYKIMNVTLEDNRVGQWLSDGKDELKAGMEVELEIEVRQYNGVDELKFKYFPKNGKGGGGFRGKTPEERDEIVRQNAIGNAVKLICDNPNVRDAVKGKERDSIYTIADGFIHYIKTGQRPGTKTPAQPQQQTPPAPQPQQQPVQQPVQQPQQQPQQKPFAQQVVEDASKGGDGLPF